MVYAHITESTSDCGNAMRRLYILNVDPSCHETKNDVLEFLHSFEPSPELNIETTNYEVTAQDNQKQNKLTYTLKQNSLVSFIELSDRKQNFSKKLDILTGYDLKNFSKRLVEMMKTKGWTLTQYSKNWDFPTREWTFYKEESCPNLAFRVA